MDRRLELIAEASTQPGDDAVWQDNQEPAEQALSLGTTASFVVPNNDTFVSDARFQLHDVVGTLELVWRIQRLQHDAFETLVHALCEVGLEFGFVAGHDVRDLFDGCVPFTTVVDDREYELDAFGVRHRRLLIDPLLQQHRIENVVDDVAVVLLGLLGHQDAGTLVPVLAHRLAVEHYAVVVRRLERGFDLGQCFQDRTVAGVEGDDTHLFDGDAP